MRDCPDDRNHRRQCQQIVRERAGGALRDITRRARAGDRTRRPQRRRQDHAAADARVAPRAGRGDDSHRRSRPVRGPARGETAARMDAGRPRRVAFADRPRDDHDDGAAVRHAGAGRDRPGGAAAGARRSARSRRLPGESAVARPEAEARPRPRARARSAGAAARRARIGSRSGGAHPAASAAQAIRGRGAHGADLEPHPVGARGGRRRRRVPGRRLGGRCRARAVDRACLAHSAAGGRCRTSERGLLAGGADPRSADRVARCRSRGSARRLRLRGGGRTRPALAGAGGIPDLGVRPRAERSRAHLPHSEPPGCGSGAIRGGGVTDGTAAPTRSADHGEARA